MRLFFALALALCLALCAGPALANGISVETSSTARSLFMGFSPQNLMDGDPATAWAEGGSGAGQGEWVEITLARPMALERLVLRNGFASETWFTKFNRVKTLEIRFPDGGAKRFELEDTMEPQSLALDGRVTDRLRLVIVDVYAAMPLFNPKTTCLSEVEVVGALASQQQMLESRSSGQPPAGSAARALAEAMSPAAPGKDGAGSQALPAAKPGQEERAARARAARPATAVTQAEPLTPMAPKAGQDPPGKAASALKKDYAKAQPAVNVVYDYYRLLTTLSDDFPRLFSQNIRHREAFNFEVFREYQRKRGTFDKFRASRVDTDSLDVSIVSLTDDEAVIDTAGHYTVYVDYVYEDIPEQTRFTLSREHDGWKIVNYEER